VSGNRADRERIRVLLVDDHGMFMECLERVLHDELDIGVVGKAASGAVAVRLAESLRPAVAIVDSLLSDGDGAVTAEALRGVCPTTRVILLAGVGDDRLVTAAINAGCSGFLTKDRAVRELVTAVRLANAGDAYLSPDILAALLPRFDGSHRELGSDLTVRQRETLSLMVAGLGNKDIAGRLGLSLNTIRNHVQKVLVKLGAHSKLEAVAIAAREGLIDRLS
jgi:DNA-binding NarL/FixJ family response regulator